MARPSEFAIEAVRQLEECVNSTDLRSIVNLIGGGNVRQTLFHYESNPDLYDNREREIIELLRRFDGRQISQLELLIDEINSDFENILLDFIPFD